MPLVTTTPDNYDDILSSTLQRYAPYVEDNFYNALPFWHFLNEAGAVQMYDGGESVFLPILFGDNTTAQALVNAYDQVSVTPQNNMTGAQYIPRFYTVSITISLQEELDNSGESKAIDLLQQKTESAEFALRNLMNTHAWADTSAIPGSILGLQESLSVNNTETVGGISKTTFSFWQNQVDTTVTNFGSTGRSIMTSLYNRASGGSSDHPTMIATNRSCYENYEATLEPLEMLYPLNSRPDAVGDPKFQTLKFRGAKLFFDEAAPDDRMYFLNPRYYFLKVHRMAHFRVTPFTKFPNQLARVAQIYWRGMVCINNMRRLAVMGGTPDDF